MPRSVTSVAVVTGASRETGLGFEVARQLARRDFSIVLTAREGARAESQAAALVKEGFDVVAHPLDVTDDASVETLRVFIESEFDRLDSLVNNAGGFYDAGVSPLSADFTAVKQAFELNLYGAWRMTRAFLPLLKLSRYPRIVNVSSGAGSFADPDFGLSQTSDGLPAYGLSKLALNGLTVKLAKELKPHKILVNSVCPGFTATTPGLENYGARPVADGASGIVWAASLPDDGPTGGFFRDGKEIGW